MTPITGISMSTLEYSGRISRLLRVQMRSLRSSTVPMRIPERRGRWGMHMHGESRYMQSGPISAWPGTRNG